MRRRNLIGLCGALLLCLPSSAEALQCGNIRYLPADTTWRLGTGPAYGGTWPTTFVVGCVNSKRSYDAYGFGVAEVRTEAALPGWPASCEFESVRVFSGTFEWGPTAYSYLSTQPTVATSWQASGLLGAEYTVWSPLGAKSFTASWTYYGSCSALDP